MSTQHKQIQQTNPQIRSGKCVTTIPQTPLYLKIGINKKFLRISTQLDERNSSVKFILINSYFQINWIFVTTKFENSSQIRSDNYKLHVLHVLYHNNKLLIVIIDNMVRTNKQRISVQCRRSKKEPARCLQQVDNKVRCVVWTSFQNNLCLE